MKHLIILLLIASSCTTVKNAQRRHDRIRDNFPNVHKVDTVTIDKLVTIELAGFKDSNTFSFEISYDTIRDTIYFPDSVVVVNTIWMDETGLNTLKTDIEQPTRIVEKLIEVKVPAIETFVKTKWYWWLLAWTVGLIMGGVGVVVGLSMLGLVKKQKQWN